MSVGRRHCRAEDFTWVHAVECARSDPHAFAKWRVGPEQVAHNPLERLGGHPAESTNEACLRADRVLCERKQTVETLGTPSLDGADRSHEHFPRPRRLERGIGQLRAEVSRYRDAVEMRGEPFIPPAEMHPVNMGRGHQMPARAAQRRSFVDVLGNDMR
jgi:hypothetical protein